MKAVKQHNQQFLWCCLFNIFKIIVIFSKMNVWDSFPLEFFGLPVVPFIPLFLCCEGEPFCVDIGLTLDTCFLLALGDASGCLL